MANHIFFNTRNSAEFVDDASRLDAVIDWVNSKQKGQPIECTIDDAVNHYIVHTPLTAKMIHGFRNQINRFGEVSTEHSTGNIRILVAKRKLIPLYAWGLIWFFFVILYALPQFRHMARANYTLLIQYVQLFYFFIFG